MKHLLLNKKIFLQVNTGKEKSKSGIFPEDVKDFLFFLKDEMRLYIHGLMCIPPMDKQSKDYFNEMKSLRNKLNPNLLLSMGMSNDYKVSLECGSNLIRIGSRIFS